MENHFSRYSKITLSVLVIILSLSLSFTTVYGQGLQGQSTLQERLAQRGIDLKQLGERVRYAMQVQNRNRALLKKFGVTGMGTGITPEGEAVINVFTASTGITGIPANLEGVSVKTKVTGKFYALRDDSNTCEVSGDSICKSWERWPLPVPIGVSIGHPAISAGTFGARVTDGTDVFVLSNNHVLANINKADINDPILQPGSWDGGVNDDAVANLSDFEPIDFCTVFWIWLICDQTNTIDAAIARSTPGEIGFETPTGQYGSGVGYGAPSSIIHAAYGNPNVIGDEDLDLLLGRSVQKYGRTTGNTVGTINTINATVNVCYDDSCSMVARFVDQIIITPGSFSAGGDSGSLIVTNDADKNPVGLLFAGSDTDTIANRIDLVLNRFGVSIDAGVVDPITDVSITSVDAPASAVQGAIVDVTVILENVGNQDVEEEDSFQVILRDITAATDIGTQTVSSLAAGTFTTLTYKWNTADASLVQHTLEARHYFSDDDNGNNVNTTAVAVVDSLTDIAITSLNAPTSVLMGGTATVVVTIENVGNQNVTDDITVNLLSDNTTPADPGDDLAIGTHTIIGGLTVGDSADLTFPWNTGAAGVNSGAHVLTANHNSLDQNGANDTASTSVEVTVVEPSSGPQLETGKVWATTAGWTPVTLGHDYGQDMVVVCTPNYEYDAWFTPEPLVALVQNASGSSFQVKLIQAVGGSLQDVSADVYYMVVKAGVYTLAEHGVKMEAVKFNSTTTDGARSWIGEYRSYANSYTNPVVVGQVMTYNADRAWYWSVFWSRGSSRTNPPSSSELWVGKHKGQDPRVVNDETIGYVVIEAGEGTIGTTEYFAALGADTVRGTYNAPPYTYSLSGLSFPPATAILSQAAMDGGDGGWAVLYGNYPITSGSLQLAIEEDMVWDSERNHTTEQVGYIVFGWQD